jgi:WD40 repeat protein
MRHVVIAYNSGRVTFFDLGTCKTVHRRTEHNWEAAEFSADQRWLVTAAMGGEVALWEVPSYRKSKAFQGPKDTVLADVCLSRDSRRIVAGWWDGPVTLWDVESGKQLHVFRPESATPEPSR